MSILGGIDKNCSYQAGVARSAFESGRGKLKWGDGTPVSDGELVFVLTRRATKAAYRAAFEAIRKGLRQGKNSS